MWGFIFKLSNKKDLQTCGDSYGLKSSKKMNCIFEKESRNLTKHAILAAIGPYGGGVPVDLSEFSMGSGYAGGGGASVGDTWRGGDINIITGTLENAFFATVHLY